MENEKTFRTKTGFCHILSDKIILTRDGIIGNVAKITVGNGISRTLLIYSTISIFLLYSAYSSLQKGENVSVLFFGLLAIFLIYGIIKSINNSATPIIERSKIKEAKFINAKVGLTRSRFEILFEDENGKLKKRLIMLPGSLNDGTNETEKALTIMKSERILAS
ncbi:phosphoribosylaminoimidazolesuccinocarboxamide synthase [Flavobacterium praedii]|uniref:phosphoribosylaminoimidazolesuccinocarboxamide synthase n=1 Tax=Flavobacterium praedii TaxID=3002900 RepID=UPI002481DD21|nr:phosphoribosylaminoimidazolesuccinocarboxamide synthase [Flavobacterium praedii]